MTALYSSDRADWQAALASAYTHLDDLLNYLEIPAESLGVSSEAAMRFPLRVTRHYAARIRKGDPTDPLLRQVLPVTDELAEAAGFSADPVGDLHAVAAPGVLHKYQGRALLITTGVCAVHCRYCFRREFPYHEGQMTRQRQTEAVSYLAADATIKEVILSGGDPLVLSDRRLFELVSELARIEHLERLRIHTRLPLFLPARVTVPLCKLLRETRLGVVVVIHANHARELDDAVGAALRALRESDVSLLNQSVLLRGVNDDADTLAELSEALFARGVLPYYLHLLDKAKGTAHFEVEEPLALSLYDSLRRRLPGYLVPRLVREEAGKPYKIWRI